MKKLISILTVVSVLLLMFSCCEKENPEDKTTTAATTQTVTEKATQAETTKNTESETELITTTRPAAPAKAGKYIIDDGENRYIIEKTAFEKNYSEEFLLKIYNMLPMDYGYENYYNWNGKANEILNDATICCYSSRNWWFERFDYGSEQKKVAKEEIMSYGEDIKCHEYAVTDIDKINEFLVRSFGPNADVIEKEDFEYYGEIAKSGKYVFEDFDYNHRYFYLPESELVICCINEFRGEETRLPYIYDIQEKDGLYIVKALTGREDLSFADGTFMSKQNGAWNSLNSSTNGWLDDWTFYIASDKYGDLYMNNVETSCVLPENVQMNYVVSSSENVEVKTQKYCSSDWEVIDTLSPNEKIYSMRSYFSDMRYVITPQYVGLVDKEYLIEIE